jgi:hypothetical protein
VVDSRTILDSVGAEKFVGRGDMLFASAQVSKPKRVQGPFVSDFEVKRVVSFLVEEIGLPDYLDEVTEVQPTPTAFMPGGSDGNDGDGDELYEDAKQTVIDAGKASTSYLQRKLRVGYARAARIMDLLEEAGVVGPSQGSKPREVLITGDEDDTIYEDEDMGEDPINTDHSQGQQASESDSELSDDFEEDDDDEEDYNDDSSDQDDDEEYEYFDDEDESEEDIDSTEFEDDEDEEETE